MKKVLFLVVTTLLIGACNKDGVVSNQEDTDNFQFTGKLVSKNSDLREFFNIRVAVKQIKNTSYEMTTIGGKSIKELARREMFKFNEKGDAT